MPHSAKTAPASGRKLVARPHFATLPEAPAPFDFSNPFPDQNLDQDPELDQDQDPEPDSDPGGPEDAQEHATSAAKSPKTSIQTHAKLGSIATFAYNANSIQNFDQLMAAIKSRKIQITLGQDIIVPYNIVIDYDLALNLNGHNLISEQTTPDARVLDIRRGEVTIMGPGKIFAMGIDSIAVRVFGAMSSGMPGYTALTVDENVSLFALSGTGIMIAQNFGAAYGVTVNFSGEIVARNGICLSPAVRGRESNPPELYIKSGARIIADENTGVAIDALGVGHWQIGAAKIYGATGLRAGFGEIAFTHAQIVASAPAIELAAEEPGVVNLLISGGNYISEQDAVISGNPEMLSGFMLENCRLGSPLYAMSQDLEDVANLSGCEHRTDIANLIAELTPSEPVVTLADTVALEDTFVDEPELKITHTAEVYAPAPQPSAPVNITLNPETTKPTTFADPETPVAEPAKALTCTPVKQYIPPQKKPHSDSLDNLKALHAEREALCEALSNALSDMRKLRSTDYTSGFPEFEVAVLSADVLLSDPNASFEEIRDTASDLLDAINGLETASDQDLSDHELDHLFYHEAVLQELSDTKEETSSIDEQSPSECWSTGVTMIDELTPVTTHRQKKFSPRRFFHGLSAGLHAGVAAFRQGTV